MDRHDGRDHQRQPGSDPGTADAEHGQGGAGSKPGANTGVGECDDTPLTCEDEDYDWACTSNVCDATQGCHAIVCDPPALDLPTETVVVQEGAAWSLTVPMTLDPRENWTAPEA